MVVRGLRHAPRPFFVWCLLVAGSDVLAQDPVRPWLGWRTIATPNYRFHYLPEFEQWTRDVAARVESVDSAIIALVGSSAPKPVHVVVDDPFQLPNGYALPFRDRPVTVWWATPADPRSDIGNYTTWGELLSIHELTHLAHLTRPSRNPFQRSLWASLPVNLGPIARKTPRWVYEGYATLVEGRISGTGRPNNAWRPAILRQWAIEGRLPAYHQLDGWNDFNGGEFAYLGGSAFLEWLTAREGDSSLVHVWRRLSARQVRTFETSFAGVYGDAPAVLYGRHAAELTRDAMAAKAVLERAGLVEGELVQRLSWATGDPAISPNGERVAILLRERDRPARLVVWKTAPEPEDTAAARRRIEALKRDPTDVPDRHFYPRSKTPVKMLLASNGRSFQMPRWFADNRRVLVTRWRTRRDGTVGPALYVWDTETDDVRRITAAVGVMHGDPHPNGVDAVAMQCHWGHCDIAHVDLRRGVMRTLLEGNARTTYHRPRYSPDGTRIVAGIAEEGRWRVVVADTGGRVMRHIDPEDGANRYDAQWLGNDAVVVVSERGGIPNLELISVGERATRSLTRVTGAAVGADVNARDGSIWFLSMHSLGFDLRRLSRESTKADSVVAISSDRFGFAGATARALRELVEQPVTPPRPYGSGPRHQRWIPGGYASADGAGGFISVYSGDVVGRLTATVTGAYGENGTWRGGSLRAAWRFPRPAIEIGAHGLIHEPSFGRHAQRFADSLDASLFQGLLAATTERQGEGWLFRARLGGAGGALAPRLGASRFRGSGFAELDVQLGQSRGSRGLTERLRVHLTEGHTHGTYTRALASLELATTGRDAMPLHLAVTIGRLIGSPHVFEQFAIGGAASPLADSSLTSQRYYLPMFPTAVARDKALLAWRATLPANPWTIFYEGASAAANLYGVKNWNRAVGLESRFLLPATPVAFVPRIQMRGGAAYTLDAPFRKKLRGFFEMTVQP
jgi:Tol biopolymer transport system component